MFGFQIQDVFQQVIGVVKDVSQATNKSGANSSHSLDYSFITPTLLALGKVNDINVDELLHVLQGQQALFWNLSGKPLSSTIPIKLNHQVIENPWVTPGHFTQAPSLECVFRQCYSIKAWLDLKDDHIAVLHCGNGRHRTGILMACYLKYIGAFEKSSEAFDYFCGTRLKKDAIPTLSPSYRILFENVDRSTEYGGSPNPFPLHLKCLSISGLPVDEIPCVEVWDMSGLVFSSHRGESYNNTLCTWSAEYGDGFYRIQMDIIGDFSIMCRFGGSHSLTRDKTTLIFKYQNSTAFLPPDVVELSKHNVDLNPEYADSLEDSVFSMHLMFDSVDEASMSKSEYREFAESYQLRGKEAYESGLDEISKYHAVEPDSSRYQQLAEMKFPPEYINVALQLGNNDLSLATSIMALLLARSHALKGVKSPRPILPASPYHVKLQKTSIGVRRSGEKARSSMENLQIVDIKTKLFEDKKESRPRSKDRSRKDRPTNRTRSRSDEMSGDNPQSTHGAIEDRGQKERHRSSSEVGNLSEANQQESSPSVVSSVGENPVELQSEQVPNQEAPSVTPARDCGLCDSSDYSLRDQLVPCTKCHLNYHTKCFGGKRIPFSIKSIKERSNRDRYIAKYFSDWICPICQDSQLTSSFVAEGSEPLGSGSVGGNPVLVGESSGESNMGENNGSRSNAGAGAGDSSGKSLGAKIFGSFRGKARSQSTTGITTVDTLESNGEETICNPMFVPSGKVGFKQAGSPVPTKSMKTLSSSSNESDALSAGKLTQLEDFEKLITLLAANGLSMEQLLSMPEQQQKETLLAVSQQSQDKSLTQIPLSQHSDSSLQSSPEIPLQLPPLSAEILQNLSKSDPKFQKYSKMFQVGLPIKTIEEKMRADGIDINKALTPFAVPSSPRTGSRADTGMGGFGGNGTGVSSSEYGGGFGGNGGNSGFGNGSGGFGDDGFGGLGLGGPGINGDGTGNGFGGNGNGGNGNGAGPGNGNGTGSEFGGNGGGFGSHGGLSSPSTPNNQAQKEVPDPKSETKLPDEVIISDTDPRFVKYFQMMKLGLPKLAVAHKMQTDGAVPSTEIAISILDRKPILEKDLVASEQKVENEISESKETIEGPKVTFIDHPEYGKFFKMMKAGIPVQAVKAKMTQEGFNPDFLDRSPTDIVPDLPKKSPEGEMVACQDHPIYSKYFRMLKVGLPLPNVRAKMEQDGFDPSILEKSPTEMIPVEIEKKDEGPGEMVVLQDHPAYGKYLRMLKVGLPLAAAKQKMIDDGFDPTILDKKVTEMVPLDTTYRAPAPKLSFKKPTKSPALKIRKKKLHWKALDKSRVGADSVWAADEEEDGFTLDDEEFNELFVQKEQKEAAKAEVAETKKKVVVNLIDGKRAQNAGIALARLKMPYVNVRERIIAMDDRAFSVDQFSSLLEYLPTYEEKEALKRYRGEYDLLGPAEKYMTVMMECPDANQRIQCILFKLQWRNRQMELIAAIKRLEDVCDDVKLSGKLKKVLKTILKVGNQMNDGEDHMGFTVDSLLKLQSAKAFDKKTSILQYVVKIISRNDESTLLFPEEIPHLVESDRLSIDQITSETTNLQTSFVTCRTIVNEIASREGKEKIQNMIHFLNEVENQLDNIGLSIDVMKGKYQGVLAYFGEEVSLPSQEFFSTLEKFVRAFIEEREIVDRLRRAEEKKATQERQRKTMIQAAEMKLGISNLPTPPQPAQQPPQASAPGDKRRLGPNGAVVSRRNSSFM